MKISQQHAILIKKSLSVKAVWRKFGKGWKLRSINSLLKRICKTGKIVWQPGSGRPHLSRSNGVHRAQSGRQAK